MRVMHVISEIDPAHGGPASALVGLAIAQVNAGLDVRVVATYLPRADLSQADRLANAGVKVHLVGPCTGLLSTHPQLKSVLDSTVRQADVMHVHALWEDIQHRACQAAQRYGVPYVLTPHGMLDPWSLAQSKWKKRIYLAWRMRHHLNRAAAIHYTTETERKACMPLQLLPRALVEPLGVDLGEFESLPPKGVLRAKYPQLQGRPVIAFLGRLHPGKGMEYLIPAMARLRTTNAILVVIGPDSDGFQKVLANMTRRHAVADRVLFTGFMGGADRIAAVVDADVFSLPSDHENFGVAVVEALACGVPVIITDHVNIHHEIRAAELGGVVPRANIVALAAELDRWLADEALRRTTHDKARQFVWRTYDWNVIARHWAAHYAIAAAHRLTS